MKRFVVPLLAALVLVPVAHSATQTYPDNAKLGWGAVRVDGGAKPEVRFSLIQGDSPAQLARGLAHWEETPMPGQTGAAVFSGHRTTYGAWLRDLDRWPLKRTYLRLYMRLPQKKAYCYRLASRRVVPGNSRVPGYTYREAEVVQTWACHPPGSAAMRIVGYWWRVPCSEAD